MSEIWTEPRIYMYLAVAGCLGVVLWLLLSLRYGLRRSILAATLVTLFSVTLGLLYMISLSSMTETQTSGQSWPGAIAVAGLEGLFALVMPLGSAILSFCAASMVAVCILESHRSRHQHGTASNGGS